MAASNPDSFSLKLCDGVGKFITPHKILAEDFPLPIHPIAYESLDAYSTVAPVLPYKRLDLMNLTSNKAEDFPGELKSCTFETIELRYPANEGLHIYTDSSYLLETNDSWHEMVLWWLFEDSLAVGKDATNYDGEVSVVCQATAQLLAAGLDPVRVVFLIDSQNAVLALRSNTSTDCLHTIQCPIKFGELISYGCNVALQLIPSQVGIHSIERTNQNDKQEAE
ncbi:reverse transcriptase [Trichonephila clavipes]|nr:reverse transcriptase [Trichonephila clavipes]